MEGTIGEIRLFAGNFAPQNWAFCAGQIISIASNTALFAILGVTYGGNGQTTFALPDLRGRTAIGAGNGKGLTPRVLGEVLGTESNTLLISNLPMHNHTLACNNSAGSGSANSPEGAFMGVGPVDRSSGLPVNTRYATSANAIMAPMSVGVSGSSQPVNNLQPLLCTNYIICMYGIFPSRN
jgi:microcystin-dependent protein